MRTVQLRILDRRLGTEFPLRRVLQVVNPSAIAATRRVVAGFRPDVVHVRSFLSQLSPCILPQLRGAIAILHVRERTADR